MDLHSDVFPQGRMTGEGNDDIGPFLIEGKYDNRQATSAIGLNSISAHHSVFLPGISGKAKAFGEPGELPVLIAAVFIFWAAQQRFPVMRLLN